MNAGRPGNSPLTGLGWRRRLGRFGTVARVVATARGGAHARALMLLFACPWAGLVTSATPLRAQLQRPSGAQLEMRSDLIAARTPALHGGVSINVPAGRYVRLGGTVAGGTAWRHGTTRGSGRGDLTARFLLDPFAEFSRAIYGVGGVSLMYDAFERWRPRLVVGVGVESRPRNGRTLAAEVALGGGLRLGGVLRRARAVGR